MNFRRSNFMGDVNTKASLRGLPTNHLFALFFRFSRKFPRFFWNISLPYLEGEKLPQYGSVSNLATSELGSN